MPKTLIVIFLVIFSIFILISLARQISEALTSGKRLDHQVEEVSKLQMENRQLKEKLSFVRDFNYIEEIARNKLNLAKPGETVVVIPDQAIKNLLNSEKKFEEEKVAYWEGWMRLFFR